MANKARNNNQDRRNQVNAHQKKIVGQRRKRLDKGEEIKAIPPFRANNRKKEKGG